MLNTGCWYDGMVYITQYSALEIRRHLLLDLTRLFVVDELVLDELLVLVDLFFLSSSSSSSSLSFLVEVDGARFGVDWLLRVSVRVLVTSRFG